MYEVVQSDKIISGKIFDIYKEQIKYPDDKIVKRDIVKTSDCSGVLALFDDDSILLCKQYRAPVGKVLFEIPAGKIEEDETPKDGAIRELLEETGYVCDDASLMISMYTSPGFTTEKIYLYLTRVSENKKTKQKLDTDEYVEFVKVPMDKVIEMINNDEIQDGKTIAALTYYLTTN